ncbi:hypothetical protein QBC40DRAFT_270545 [Triangularia verruculosa]|uniref:Myb-like domain-containing protein n=1 Tax=Triangularia verruculosa TaxID=2587418 RepID=A0AAN6XRX5_9PEZI|nr:hypothetical protein QBC40DRAFT_270545 [Triangularia verruculosa]
MNKNWNDRADKDLFFTILSVKNIGVISGSEWTTIGNHMRSMGYGFTNEGCRQHFQGLRRAQNKADANSASADNSPRKIDPTLNPITRRPGPGRGRPRKNPAPPTAADHAATAAAVTAAGAPGQIPGQAPGLAPGVGVPPGGVPGPMPSAAPGPPGVPPGVGAPPPPQQITSVPVPVIPGMPAPMHPMYSHNVQPQGQTPIRPPSRPLNTGGAPPAQMDSPDLAVDPNLEDDSDEHVAKRQRLDDSQNGSLDDEAMMNALAAHNEPTPGDYSQDFSSYGEA